LGGNGLQAGDSGQLLLGLGLINGNLGLCLKDAVFGSGEIGAGQRKLGLKIAIVDFQQWVTCFNSLIIINQQALDLAGNTVS